MDFETICDTLDEIDDEPQVEQRLAELRRVLATVEPGHDGHAETLSRIADELAGSGQPDAARSAYEEVIADGGRTILDPHIGLLTIELEQGGEARVDELLALLLARSRADELVLGDYEWIGESLEDAGRARQALRWFTIPLRDIQPGDVDLMPIVCLNGRFRVRRDLGLPIDAYDEAHDLWHELNQVQQGSGAG